MEREGGERTPEEEAKVQAIKAFATLALVVALSYLQRVMSDPDVTYRAKWHLERWRKNWERAAHNWSTNLEVAVGLVQIERFIKRKWRERTVSE